MLHKTYNLKAQDEEDLRLEVEKLYRRIENGYKLIKKISDKEEAHKIIERIWVMKACANDIQLELTRREYNNEAQAENGTTY